MKARHAAVLLLVLAACGRTDHPEAARAPVADPAPPLSAWSWHPLGGLAVVEGEVSAPTELVLEGRSILEHRFAEQGPVRWEFFRPPPGEPVVLRTADGRVLARFEFSLPAEPPKAPPAPRLARRAEPAPAPAPPPLSRPVPGPAIPKARAETRWQAPPVAAPPPEPPPPKARADARVRNITVAPIPGRTALALPSAAVPAEAPRRASSFLPALVDPVVPRPASPAPAPIPLATPIPRAGTAPAWPGMGEALNLTRGPGGQKHMLLSFDGGSSAEVAIEVLDLLKAR
ncbi:MAG: hypothetical protein P4L11_12470, partial [Geothrix sp.]|nr:hypothetical protein [Geothrix sp.]